MILKSLDRFFVFVLALSTALYFFGSKPGTDRAFDKAVSLGSNAVLKYENFHQGNIVPPVGTETREEQPSEDDEPTNSHQSAAEDHFSERAPIAFNSISSIISANSIAQQAYHCPLHIRLRSIII